MDSKNGGNGGDPRPADYLQTLLKAASKASGLGIAVVDQETRFEIVNRNLARENYCTPLDLVGKTTREGVGEVASQIEPVYEQVFRSGKPASVWLQGRIRDAVDTGSWYDRCFPIFDSDGRVRQQCVLVVNVTEVRAAEEIVANLVLDHRMLSNRVRREVVELEASLVDFQIDMLKLVEQIGLRVGGRCGERNEAEALLRTLDREMAKIRKLADDTLSDLPIGRC